MGKVHGENGATITDDMLEELAEQYEQGIYTGIQGPLVERKAGRPRIASEPLVPLTFRVTPAEADMVRTQARREGKTVSAYVREKIAVS